MPMPYFLNTVGRTNGKITSNSQISTLPFLDNLANNAY